jgi:uncharacterized protein YjbJ (UPF0337 family)
MEGNTVADNHKSGPEELIRGIIEGIFGKVKQIVGTLIGRGDVVREGEAQQDKADAQREAAKKEAAAEKARAKAKTDEAREKTYQK